jgi:hypothetical protein
MKQLLTHSRMATHKSCRKQDWFAYELGIRKEVDAKALRMGSAGHSGLHALKRGLGLAAAMEQIEWCYGLCQDGLDTESWLLELETMRRLICGYEWRWSESGIEYIATEKAFQIPLQNPSTHHPSRCFNLAGKIDGIVKLEDGRIAVMEHKFISDSLDSDSSLWRRLRIDQQISLYVLAARQLGYDVESVLYDVVRKPAIQPCQVPDVDTDGNKIVLDSTGSRVFTKQGKPRQTGDSAKGYTLQTRIETVSEFGHRLTEDIGKRPDFYFARVEIPRLDDTLDEFAHELWEVQQTIRECQRHNRWFRTVGKHTCDYCSYFDLCSNGFDPSGPTPEGFVQLENIHPELED